MSTTFFRLLPFPPSIRAQASVLYGSGIATPNWYVDGAEAFYASGVGSGLAFVAGISGLAGSGFVAACGDGASGAYFLHHVGTLVQLTSGGVVSGLPGVSGSIFTGLTLGPSNTPFAVTAAGAVSKLVSGALSGVGSFTIPAVGLVTSGALLYSVLPSVSGIGSFNTGSLATGIVTTPMASPALLASSGQFVAVAGWDGQTIASGFSAIAPAVSGAFFVGATLSSSGVSQWLNDGNENWTETQIVSGAGQPISLTWQPDSSRVFASDTTNNHITILSYTFGSLAIAQTIPLTGVAAVAVTLNSAAALAIQPSQNKVTPLVVSGSGWAASGTSLTIANPQSIIDVSTTQMIVGNSSGLTPLQSVCRALEHGHKQRLAVCPDVSCARLSLERHLSRSKRILGLCFISRHQPLVHGRRVRPDLQARSNPGSRCRQQLHPRVWNRRRGSCCGKHLRRNSRRQCACSVRSLDLRRGIRHHIPI